MLDLGELLLVKTPMEVILRVTIVVKKMMVVMKHGPMIAVTSQPMSFVKTRVADGMTTKVTPVVW
jgi:hypothetical protein